MDWAQGNRAVDDKEPRAWVGSGGSEAKDGKDQEHGTTARRRKRVSKGAIHKSITELLPWLVNGSLAGRERERVLAHLRGCAECRAERDTLQRLQSAVESAPAPETDHALSLARVNRRIDAWEAERESEVVATRTGFAWRTGIAAAVVFAIGLSVQLVNKAGPAGSSTAHDVAALGEFETMTAGDPVQAAHRISITLSPDLDSEALRSFLIDHRARLVSGPDSEQTYVLDFPGHENGVAGLLGTLRESPLVLSAAAVGE